jgi:hypothetical protein
MDRDITGEDQYVIHVDNHPSFIDLIFKDPVHEGLERGRGVTESKEHYCGFKESEFCDKCGFPAVFWVNKDIVVSPSDVHLSEDI